MTSRAALVFFARKGNPMAGAAFQLTIVSKSETPLSCTSLHTCDVVQTLRKPFLVELQEVTVLVVPLNLGILDYHSSVCCLSDDLLVHVDILERLHFVVRRTVGLQLGWEFAVRYQGCWKSSQIFMSRIFT